MSYLQLEGKKALIAGVANERSIAWGIAKAFGEAGMRLAFTYQDKLAKWVLPLVESIPNSIAIPCDATSDEDLAKAKTTLEKEFGGLHAMAHCIAFAPPEDLKGGFIDATREGWRIAQDVSAYSLVAMSRQFAPLMTEGGSIFALTYIGSERVMGNYHLMGTAKASLEAAVRYLASELGQKNIRVNAISAGPIKTLSAKGISGFGSIQQTVEERAPLRRNVSQEDVADSALFLISPRSQNITGQILYVDAGYSIMGI